MTGDGDQTGEGGSEATRRESTTKRYGAVRRESVAIEGG